MASAAVAGWTERASTFVALVGDNLLFVGCRVTENRRDGNHRDTAITAHRRRKFDCSVFDRINTHHKPHALYTFIYLTRSLRPSFPVASLDSILRHAFNSILRHALSSPPMPRPSTIHLKGSDEPCIHRSQHDQSRLTLASTTAHNLKAIAGVKFNGAVQTDGNKWLLTGLLV